MIQRSGMCPSCRFPCLWLTWMLPIQPWPGLLQVHPLSHPRAAHTHLCSPQPHGSSNSPSHAQLFQRAALGGTGLFLFGSLGFVDDLCQAVRALPNPQSVTITAGPSIGHWEGVALRVMSQCPAHRLAQLLGESSRVTQVP